MSVLASRRLVSGVLSGLLMAGLVSAAPAIHAAPAGPLKDGSTAAMITALASGERVEVAEKTTETSQTFANPDGRMTLEQHVLPVRARRGGGWVPVDRTLERDAAGAVSPRAAATPLEFSGGGSAPLVRLGKDGRQLTLRWPDTLPAPTLSGDSATYAEVLPGVDLRVKADVAGFSHVLVVKTPAAARNPRLAKVSFGLETKGISVRAGAGGVLNATDDGGKVVFQAPPAQMWDAGAKVPQAGERPQRRAIIPVELSSKQLRLVPDQKMLTDPGTRFPVEIDPTWSTGQNGWGLVYDEPSGYRGNTYWGGDGDGVAKVGYSSWESPTVRIRSYFQFDISALLGSQVLGAEANFLEVHAPSCAPKWVDLYHTGGIDAGLNWNNQPGWISKVGWAEVAHGYPGCGPDWVGFDVGGAVASSINAWGSTVTFGLVSGDEGASREGNLSWKKFDPNPNLIVTYNNRPFAPSDLASEPKGPCGTEPNEPYITTATPILKARITDPNGDRVRAHFAWGNRFAGEIGSQDMEFQESGSEFRLRIPDGSFKDGSKIAWRVQGRDIHDFAGDYSSWCDITVDLTPPNTMPSVTSTVYPENGEGGAPGQTAAFEFNANGDTDVAEFRYRLDGQEEKIAKAVNGKATAYITPPTRDPYTLHVVSADRAGNRAPADKTKDYRFRVGVPSTPTGYWKLDGRNPSTTVLSAVDPAHDGSFAAGKAKWVGGRVGDALEFDGRTPGAWVSTAGGPSVNTTESFTVSAWVRLDRSDGVTHAAVSQDGTKFSRFSLNYIGGQVNAWGLFVTNENNGVPDLRYAFAKSPPQLGMWTHLTGVYNSSENRIEIYVNGVLAGTADSGPPQPSAGALQIGRAMWDGNQGDNWAGAIDEVKVYNRALPDVKVAEATEIDKLATRPATEEASFRLDEGTGTTTTDASGNYRAATLQPGVTWAPGKVGKSLRFNGSGSVSAEGPAVRTDNSFTVSAFVNMDRAGETRIAVSQDGERNSGFSLMWHTVHQNWVFSVPQSDADGATMFSAPAPKDPKAATGSWVHLTGVYDASVPEIRLYVDGVQVANTPTPGGIQTNAAKPLQIGRGKWAGRQADPFLGSIDEVHLYSGVRTAAEINEERLDPVTDRAWSGALARYISYDADHFSASGPVPRGYRLEHPLGWLVPVGTPGTLPLYSCRFPGMDEVTSHDPNCEGWTKLGTLGAVYQAQPAGEPTQMLYRCHTGAPKYEHFESLRSDCEGFPVDGPLGYVLSYAMLSRYLKTDLGADRRTSIGGVPAPYQRERSMWAVSTSATAGTVPLMLCEINGDKFSSLSAGCEGKTALGQAGWIWASPPAGLRSLPLSRCKTLDPDGKTPVDRFDSITDDCEGQDVVDVLGYVVVP
ncbi:LamG-like jellyroll fold domain-containing protein [Amycolatopsis sp. NPDC051128]|uniref:LamG-like jellyroll fold domain-containing protein n=1 Tax=Amycolatopsis sp. NPDC051128 TaxID=3155412 RepID=UPI003432F8AD